MPLYEIRVHYETHEEHEVERLVEAIERAICPHPAEQNHRCPNRWNIMTVELDPGEAAELDELLNE